MSAPLVLVLPGPLVARTGGTIYDRRIVEGLRAEGRAVRVVELPGRYPLPDASARAAARDAFAALPDGSVAVVDGLALGALPEVAREHGRRLSLVALVHHPLVDETGLTEDARRAHLAAERAALSEVRGIVVTSRATARRLAELALDDARLLPVALDARVVEPGVDAAPPAQGRCGAAPPTLLALGALTPRKAQLDLLAALGDLLDLEWRLVVVGRHDQDPSYAAAVERAARAPGLAGRVTLTGEVEDARRDALLAAADVFVHPARHEGYGMAVAEAIARGVPVVTTTGGALAETLPEGAGLAVPPGDVDALRAALRRVLAEPGLRASLSAGARRARARQSSWSDAARAFGAAVDALAGGVRP